MIKLKEALGVGRLQEAELITGQVGLSRPISGVTVMDIPEIADWLTGGELVLAGVLFQQYFSKNLVDSFLEKGVAGIVTKRKFINSIPPQLFAYCKAKEFPVLLAPADCNWGQIMNPITSYMAQKPYLIIEATQNFHYTMMQAMIEGISLSEMCTRMRDSMGMSFAIMDNDLHLIGFSGDFDWKEQTRNVTTDKIQYAEFSFRTFEEGQIYVYTYSNLLLRSIGKKIILYPVILNHVKYGYIAMAVDDDLDQMSSMDIVKIQQLGLFVALHSTMQNEISTATRRFNGLLMDQLLSGDRLTQQQAETLLAPLDKKIHRNYYAVQFIHDGLRDIDSYVQRNTLLGHFHTALEEKLELIGHILIFEKTDAQILLIPHPTPNLNGLLFELRSIFLETTGLTRVYVGVSDPVPLPEIKTALVQSERAAKYLQSSKKDLPYFHYHDLGVLKFFMDRKGELDEAFLRGIYDQYITPLVEHDAHYHTQLLETLELYLKNNCSKTETEKQLFIHKNTLRARLQSIGKLLNCDVDNVDDLFNIQIATKLKFYFEGSE